MNEENSQITEEDRNLVRQYGFRARLTDFCLKICGVLLISMLISTAISGIAFDGWNSSHNTQFLIFVIIGTCVLIGVFMIIMLVSGISCRTFLVNGKMQEILSKDSRYAKSMKEIGEASAAITFLNTMSDITRGQSVASAGAEMIGAVSITRRFVLIAEMMEEYVGLPKKKKLTWIYILVFFLAIVPVGIFGVVASLKDKNEIIDVREDTIGTIMKVYDDYHPEIDDFYHRNGNYETDVEIQLDNDSLIDVTMFPYGMGKITEISFEVTESLESAEDEEVVIDTLVNRLKEIYGRTNNYKDYYYEIFGGNVPEFQMDEEHQDELVEKLDKLLSEGTEDDYENQEQYHQTDYKTAISQNIKITYKKTDNYDITLRLTIKEHAMK